MKLADRIIFSAIAIFLGIIAARAIMPLPVRAAREEIIKVDIVRVNGLHFLTHIPVNITAVGGERCRLSDFK